MREDLFSDKPDYTTLEAYGLWQRTTDGWEKVWCRPFGGGRALEAITAVLDSKHSVDCLTPRGPWTPA